MHRLLLGLCAVAFSLPLQAQEAPTPAKAVTTDYTKYLPEHCNTFIQVDVPKLFASPLVRKAVPMAFDKYQDQIVAVMPMLQGMAPPGAPKPDEEQVKKALKELSDPQKIAQMFDAAQALLTDVVVAGSTEGGAPNMVVLIKCAFITPEAIDLGANALGGVPQVQIKKVGKDKQPIYQLAVPNAGEIYLCVPEAGLLQIAMSEAQAQAAFAGKGAASEQLASLIKQRKPDDFVFTANVPGKDSAADFVAAVARCTLDKDLLLTIEANHKDAEHAADHVKKLGEKQSEVLKDLHKMLGDKAEAIMSKIEPIKPKADGTKATAGLKITGAAVETFLAK